MSFTNKTEKHIKGYYLEIGMAIGIPLGIPIGFTLGNIALGPAIGLPIGLSIGVLMENKLNKAPLLLNKKRKNHAKKVFLDFASFKHNSICLILPGIFTF